MGEQGAVVLNWERGTNLYLYSKPMANPADGQDEQYEVYATHDGTRFHTTFWRGHFRFFDNATPLPTEEAAKAVCEYHRATVRWRVDASGEAPTDKWVEVWQEYLNGEGECAVLEDGRWYETQPTQGFVFTLDGVALVKRWIALTGPEFAEHYGGIEYSPKFNSLSDAKAACERHDATGEWE